jgi:hypothetical protein
MKRIRKLFIILPIHIIMGGISLFFFLTSLNSLSHSGAEILSLSLFVVNTIGYLMLSILFLKSRRSIEVIISTSLFLGIGLFIWIIFLKTGHLGNLFFAYHISGYSSFMWYVSFTKTNESLLTELGLFYSVVPSILILFGFYLSKHIKTKKTFQRVSLYMGCVIFSVITVFLSGYNGERIENREELANAFLMKTGFPLNFAELRYPTIDPPLPWIYGGFECCSLSIFSWTNFWLSVTIVFLFLLLLLEVVLLFYRKSNNKSI